MSNFTKASFSPPSPLEERTPQHISKAKDLILCAPPWLRNRSIALFFGLLTIVEPSEGPTTNFCNTATISWPPRF